eukprot:TRINITY_DN1885_c0_g1_i6.p1 TRINITY_DN1885_c0_g1~~TRINITY_DN1885_c0_g1_i6.p1  ORF type:complete len:789 (-),score=136.27 TRINITY_DN1885_c0_g1_i6:197-2563(-)
MNFDEVDDITTGLAELVTGDLEVRVCRNEQTGKVHLLTNIVIPASSLRDWMRFLPDYLYQYVEHVYTKEEWKKGCDEKACGVRSIYSIKIKDAIESRARYLPEGEPEPTNADEFADLLWKYSIYNRGKKPVYFNAETFCDMEEAREQRLADQNRVETPEEIAMRESQTVKVFGRAHKVDAELINKFIACLGQQWKNGRKWYVAMISVRNATQFIADYDPTYFLEEWSASGEGFNRDNNIRTFNAMQPRPSRYAEAVEFLRNMACRDDIVALRRAVYTIPPVMDPDYKRFFMSYEQVAHCPKPELQPDGTFPATNGADFYLAGIHAYIFESIGLVVNGGQSMWVTKNLNDGEIEYKFIKCNSNTEKNLLRIQFIIDWKMCEKSKELKPVTTNLLQEMLNMGKKISYTRLDFVPYTRAKGWSNTERVFNQFTGLVSDHAYTPKDQEFYETELADILYHMRHVLCAGEEPAFQYLLRWLAHAVQKPETKIGVACLVRSQEGAGKTSFWEWFGKHVLGAKYYLPARMDRVVKKFNSITANNLFTVFEETRDGEGKKNHEELKQMITDDWQVIEPKGIDSYKTRSYTNYVILTNEHYPVKLTTNDRRFFCLEADNKHKADREYWVKLFGHFKDNGAATGELMFEYLHSIDIENWNSRPIETAMRRDLKMNSLPYPIQFLIDVVRGNIELLRWEDEKLRRHTADLYGYFKHWEQHADVTFKTTQMSFAKQINEVQKSERFEMVSHTGQKKRAMGFIYEREKLIANLRTYMNDPEFTVEVETENDEQDDAEVMML